VARIGLVAMISPAHYADRDGKDGQWIDGSQVSTCTCKRAAKACSTVRQEQQHSSRRSSRRRRRYTHGKNVECKDDLIRGRRDEGIERSLGVIEEATDCRHEEHLADRRKVPKALRVQRLTCTNEEKENEEEEEHKDRHTHPRVAVSRPCVACTAGRLQVCDIVAYHR